MELLGKGGVLRVKFREKLITDFWLVDTTPEYISYVERWNLQPQPLEFDGVRHDLRWYYSPWIRKSNKATEQDDSTDKYGKRNFHGSCVASKVIGATDGVSRTSQLTTFKVSSLLSDATWAFAAVRNSRTPIVVYPWAYINTATNELRRDLSTIKDIISDILEDGGIIVVSAGNAQTRSALADTFPSTLERDSRRTLQPNRHAFIVVGAVRSSTSFWSEAGSIAKFSQRSLLGSTGEYWAPGEAIRCAGPNGHQMADGTSFAAPMLERARGRALIQQQMLDTSPYGLIQLAPPEWCPQEDRAASAFVGISFFLSFETIFEIFRVFKKRQGLYFWSLLVGIVSLPVNNIAILLKYLVPGTQHIWPLYTLSALVSWSFFSIAQLLVLYSRLHLVVDDPRIQRWVLYLIVACGILFVLPIWIVVWPAWNPDPESTQRWSAPDGIVERFTQLGFTLAECIISGIYIHALWR
ncbi:MAG: hypothetical protein Q9199_002907 [Rusavskia elegans]